MTDTMELLHCKYCGHDKPADQMRKDKSYPSGFRPQCRDCKSKAEGYQRRRPKKKAPAPKAKAASKPKKTTPKKKTVAKDKPLLPDGRTFKKKSVKKTPAEDRLYSCNHCKRDDIPFSDMSKNKHKFMGVASICKPCRRSRDAERKKPAPVGTNVKAPEAPPVGQAKNRYGDEWEYCWKCNSPARPGVLSQPPPVVAAGFPDGARLCHKCLSHADSRIDHIQVERRRLGLPENPTRKQLESAARVAALKELAQTHESEFRKLFRRYLTALGAETEKSWITL